MKKKSVSHVIKKYRFFVFSVSNYFETNAASVVFRSTPLIIEIQTLFLKKIKKYDFLAPKPRFFEKENIEIRKKVCPFYPENIFYSFTDIKIRFIEIKLLINFLRSGTS
jgi:hypothetical protein